MATRRSASRVSAAKKVTAPNKPNLSFNDYKKDFLVRVQIHNYEVNALLVDVKKAYEFALPYIKQSTNYTVKTFNQVREKLQTAE